MDYNMLVGVVIICVTTILLFVKFCRSIVSPQSLHLVRDTSQLKSERRGIPTAELEPFFASFGSNSPPILGFRLKTHKSGTPQAIFSMKWKSDVYNLHLHFSSFKDTVEELELTGISHVYAVPSLGTGGYKEVGHKEKIVKYKPGNELTEQWQRLVKPSEASIKKVCMDFVTANGINWKDEQSWKMKNSVLPG